MLTVTGTAEFLGGGRLLDVKTVIQPHTPFEHDELERTAKDYGSPNIVMEHGQLVLYRRFVVPEQKAAVQESSVSSAEDEAPAQPESAQNEIDNAPKQSEK